MHTCPPECSAPVIGIVRLGVIALEVKDVPVGMWGLTRRFAKELVTMDEGNNTTESLFFVTVLHNRT